VLQSQVQIRYLLSASHEAVTVLTHSIRHPLRAWVDDHIVQSALCKLYQVLQFVFSGMVGRHGRAARNPGPTGSLGRDLGRFPRGVRHRSTRSAAPGAPLGADAPMEVDAPPAAAPEPQTGPRKRPRPGPEDEGKEKEEQTEEEKQEPGLSDA
jgi:hypothetical protein